ncbi:MAG: right-handed parallel beta-helix repeat-containing protein [Candidatus Thorarchaeota archaeon]|jgi:parallel beta-helix repeat protein
METILVQGLKKRTQEDPYIVENLNLESSSTCLSIRWTESYFVVRNCSFTVVEEDYGFTSGIYLESVSNGRIENCEIVSVGDGIYISWSKDCIIEDNVVMAEGTDVDLRYSTNCSVLNNQLYGQGIHIEGHHWPDSSDWDHSLENNTLAGVQIGSFSGLEDTVLDGNQYAQILLRDSRNVTVVGGSFSRACMVFVMIDCIDSSIVGVSTNVTRKELVMIGCHNCTLDGGNFESQDSDLIIESSSNCSVINVDGGNTSISLSDSNGSLICGSVLKDVNVYSSNDCLIEEVTARRLYLSDVEAVSLRQSHIERGSFYSVRTCLIFNNTILSQYYQSSIYAYDCSNLSITVNRINGRVNIRRSSEVTFSDNFVLSDWIVEVSFSYFCINVTVHNNQLVNSSFEIYRYNQEWSFDFSNNTVNYKPVLYLQDQENVTISGNDYSQLFLIDSQNIEVKDSSFSDAFVGVMVYDSQGCSFDNVTFQNCYEYQLIMQEASQISVTDSNFLGDSNYAILMEDSSGCNVSDSTIETRVFVETSTLIIFENCNMSFQESVYGIGLTFRYVNSSQIDSCNITDTEILVSIERSRSIQIRNNQLDAGVALSARFEISYSVNLTLCGNDFGNSRFDLDGDLPEHWHHNITDNWKDGKPLVYMKDMSDEHIDLNLYGHLVLVACRNILVSSDGALETAGLQVAYSEGVQIMGLNVNLFRECPIRIFRSYNVSFQDCRILDEGIQFVHSQNLAIIRCQILTAEYLRTSFCSNVVIEGCTFESVRIYITTGTSFSIKGCTFRFESRLEIRSVSDIMISECNFYGGYRGVQLRYCTNIRLKGVSITDCSGDALEIRSSETINVHNCNFYNSYNGLDLDYNSGGFFTGNEIFNCDNGGIDVYRCDNLQFWNNALAGNGYNARVLDSPNCTWDNGNGWGNYWDDATEGIPYVINEQSNSVDRYPRVLPNPDFGNPDINNPVDITVWQTLVENTTIEWRAMDENPLVYWIEIDGTFIESGEFHERNIVFSLPNLSVGSHTVTIVVIDPLGHTATDVVIVQVTEVPLSYLISIMLFSAYLGFLMTMVIGLSSFIIIEKIHNRRLVETKLNDVQ